MISNMLSITSVLLDFEATLNIDYSETLTERVIDAAIKKLERQYGVAFNGRTIYEIEAQNAQAAEPLQNLQSKVKSCYEGISAMQSLSLFYANHSVSLAEVKYLGLGKDQIKKFLRIMQQHSTYSTTNNAFDQLAKSVDTIQSGAQKRLLTIMLICHKLGFIEVVAAIASYLYFGIVMEDKDGSKYI